MIEAIQVAGLQAAQQASPAAAGASAQTPQASSFDVRQFAASMDAAGGAPQASTPSPVVEVQSAKPSEGMRGVLSALDGLNGGAEKIGQASQSFTTTGADMTPGQMMDMTMKAHQFLFKAELTSNVANRTSDGISQLFRQQS